MTTDQDRLARSALNEWRDGRNMVRNCTEKWNGKWSDTFSFYHHWQPPKWICLQDHLLAFFFASSRLLPVRSIVFFAVCLSHSSTRRGHHPLPAAKYYGFLGCCGGKTAKFMVPIKNQNICSTTSSVRFSWIKFGLHIRQRSWQQHQHTLIIFISPSPAAAMIYVHFIETHIFNSDQSTTPSFSTWKAALTLASHPKSDQKSVSNFLFLQTDTEGTTIVNRLWCTMCHVLMKAIFHLVERRLIALFTEKRRSDHVAGGQ